MIRRSFSAPRLALGVAVALLAPPAGAQAPRAGGPLVVHLQPVQLLATVLSGDVEVRVTPGATVGVATTIQFGELEWQDDGFDDPRRWATAELKWRWYLSGEAFRGFSLGASAGVLRLRDYANEVVFDNTGQPVPQPIVAEVSPTFGLETGWNSLIGRGRRTSVQLGLGLKRIANLDEVRDPPRLRPNARVAIGYRF